MSNHILKNGVFMGLALVAVSVILYIVDKSLLVNMSLMTVIGLAVPIYFMWKGGKDTRAEQDGFASFGEMLKVTFFIFIIGSFISNVGVFALKKFDPTILEMEADAAIEMATNMVDKVAGFTGASEDQLAEMKQEMDVQNEATKEQILNQGVGSVILNWLGGMVFGLIISLIMSALMKVK